MIKNPVIVIIGPTACGKTATSIEVAKYFDSEIISCDSMQIYKELNIGSAKVTREEMQGITHHMIDVVSVAQSYSASEFSSDTKKIIKDIHQRGKIPVIVGGTGLFIQGLIEGYDYSTCSRNEGFRAECEKKITANGLESLYNELMQTNPQRAKEIMPADKKRIIRALEIEKFASTKPTKNLDQNNYILIGLNMERQKLYERINLRVDKMLEDGLVGEVKNLYQNGYDESYQGMKGIGYKELFPYFENTATLEACVDLIKQHSRNYAKRQLTWFKRMHNISWFEPTQVKEIIQFLKGKIYD